MVVPFNYRPDREPGIADERRAHGRRRVMSLYCNLGKVLDLSRGGIRVESKRPVQGECEVIINSIEKSPVTLRAEVAWSKRTGLFKHQTGLHFIDVDAETARRLAMISTLHKYCEILDAHESG